MFSVRLSEMHFLVGAAVGRKITSCKTTHCARLSAPRNAPRTITITRRLFADLGARKSAEKERILRKSGKTVSQTAVSGGGGGGVRFVWRALYWHSKSDVLMRAQNMFAAVSLR